MSELKPIQNNIVQNDPWQALKKYTAARIALGRTGTAIPVKETLKLMHDHANARDAVYASLNIIKLVQESEFFKLHVFHLQSKAVNRQQYLQRPDLGRQLSESSKQQFAVIESNATCDIAIVIADGLSASAVQSHAIPVLQQLIPLLEKYSIMLSFIEQGRVAIADETGALLNAKLSLVLIGERPGLSAQDSMSAYLTWQPRPGLTDESRNCVSNIRPLGLGYKDAAYKINYLVQQAFHLKMSGVLLKDGYNGYRQL